MFTFQTSFHLWNKLLDVFLKANMGKCGQQLKFIMNVNEKLNFF
jgi:hypothetical protein